VRAAREHERRGVVVLAIRADFYGRCAGYPELSSLLGPNQVLVGAMGRDELRRAIELPAQRAGLRVEPELVEIGDHLRLLGGPPGDSPLADAVARGIGGVLLAERFDVVVTDLGAGPEFTRMAVGGLLNPADLCIVLSSGSHVAELTAKRIADACRARHVQVLELTCHSRDALPTGALVTRLIGG
jgi:hypothetical protein